MTDGRGGPGRCLSPAGPALRGHPALRRRPYFLLQTEGAWPRRGTRMPLCFGDYAGPRGPGRASLPGCLPPVHALARWALTGARDGRGGNPARFPVSEFPPLRGSKGVIRRRGGGSGRQYARATTRAAGGNARWARWRPRPGHRRPSAPQPRSPACARRGPRSLSRFRCETLRCRWRRQPL